MHLDEEQLQRLLHGQLPSRASRSAREHLAECTECRERYIAAERDERQIFALLRRLDHVVPAADPAALVGRLRWVTPAWGRWAAGVLLLLGLAGAAYALPGSPFGSWVRSAIAWIVGSEAPPASPTQAEQPKVGVAGIAALPGSRFVIVFESPERGGHARVSLTDGNEVSIRAPSGAASFTSAADRLIIANAGTGATFTVEVPRKAPQVEIRVAGARIFMKDGPRIEAQGTVLEGDYLIPLSIPRP